MEKVVDFVNKREKRFSKGDGQSAAFHSRSYHRHFEDWAEVQHTDENGRVHIERVYVGTYYISALSRQKLTLMKAGYILAWMLALALFIVGAVQQTEINSLWYVTAFEAAATACMFWMLIALINYMTAPGKKTVNDYRSSSLAVRYSSAVAGGALILTAASALVWKLIHLHDGSGNHWLIIMLFILAGGLCFGMNRIENRVPYTEILSDQDAPEGSIVID